jgi:hypothetical protein
MGQSGSFIGTFLGRLVDLIINPALSLIAAFAVMYFFWGIFIFIKDSDNETARNDGKTAMIWGIIGLFIIIAVHGIIGLINGTFVHG